MNDFSSLIQSNWYALANLLIELAFLAAGVWFARNILRTVRASQEQVGALLRLSIMSGSAELHAPNANAVRSLSDASPYWLAPSETQAASLPEPTESGPGRLTIARRKVVLWLQAPMSGTGANPWRRAARWLQTPAGS
jgi:hypothetical protein